MSDILAENRRARFDYDIQESLEAGIELLGHEVKSVKAGRMQIAGSYVIIRGGEAWLVNCTIPPYQAGNTPVDYEPSRTRRVLLRKEEIRHLEGALEQKSFSLLPLKAYTKKGLVKLELGLGRARKKGDKREVIKKRDVARDIARES